eukprot:scaffold492_cov257-Pinguiococcus_pyrenoidosus.AAC.43
MELSIDQNPNAPQERARIEAAGTASETGIREWHSSPAEPGVVDSFRWFRFRPPRGGPELTSLARQRHDADR